MSRKMSAAKIKKMLPLLLVLFLVVASAPIVPTVKADGELHHILIVDADGKEIGNVTMYQNGNLTLYAVGYDADNNTIGPVEVNWSVTGTLDADALSPVTGTSTTFTPSTANTEGTITADAGVDTDETGTITVRSQMEMLMGMLGMLRPLDVGVQTGDLKLNDGSTSIYVVTSSGGVPVDVTNLRIILWWAADAKSEPLIRGYWEIKDGTDQDYPPGSGEYPFGKIWRGQYTDSDGNTYSIPGLYVASYWYGFAEGDYLIWVYAEAPMGGMGMSSMGMSGTGIGGIDMSGIVSRGVGTGGFTVSETMTRSFYTMIYLPEYLQSMGASMERAMSNMEYMTTYLSEMRIKTDQMMAFSYSMMAKMENLDNMVKFQEEMSAYINEMKSKTDLMMANVFSMSGNLESMTTFQTRMMGVVDDMQKLMGIIDDMVAFQKKMGESMGDIAAFQKGMEDKMSEFKTGLNEFQQGLDAAKKSMEDLQNSVASVKTDVSETIAALPKIYEEARRIQETTAVSVPLAQILSVIAAIASIISVVLLVKLTRNFHYLEKPR